MSFSYSFRTFVLITSLLFASSVSIRTSAFAEIMEGKILTCTGKLSEAPKGRKFRTKNQTIDVFQTPADENFRWLTKGRGAITFTNQANGPIHPDGTTVGTDKDGELSIFGLSGLKTFRKKAGSLEGEMKVVQNGKRGLELYVWKFKRCKLTGLEIDPREANVWSAQEQFQPYYKAKSSPFDPKKKQADLFMLGHAIKISPSYQAEGLHFAFFDEKQQTRAFSAMETDGLLNRDGGNYFFRALNQNGAEYLVPIFPMITGAIEITR